MIALRSVNREKPAYLGSNLHISMGLEVAAWIEYADGVSFTLKLPRSTAGHVTLVLPEEPKTATQDQQPLEWFKIRDDIYRFFINVPFETEITIEW
jgi:hypothetical protein